VKAGDPAGKRTGETEQPGEQGRGIEGRQEERRTAQAGTRTEGQPEDQILMRVEGQQPAQPVESADASRKAATGRIREDVKERKLWNESPGEAGRVRPPVGSGVRQEAGLWKENRCATGLWKQAGARRTAGPYHGFIAGWTDPGGGRRKPEADWRSRPGLYGR